MIINSRDYIQTKEVPKFNEPIFVASDDYSGTQPFNYAKFIELLKRTPEAIGILNMLKTDICSDGYRFEGDKGKVKKALEFCKRNRFKAQWGAAVIDYLMLGNGALWKAKNSKADIKEFIAKFELTTGIQYKEIEMQSLMNDEDVFATKLLKHVPWSTMNIDLTPDKTSVLRFRQMLNDGSGSVPFEPEEIIHAKFMEFDGKIYGYSPMEASVNVLTTLSLIKDLNGNFFANGGVPDWIFVLPKEMAGSPNVKKLEQVLREKKNSRNKHGNLIFTGEVTPVPLNKFDKDMEFRLLAIYYTGILALAMNMPLSRLSPILGSEVTSGASATDNSEAGYWRAMSSIQDYWEDLLNSQLFEPEFDVKFKINRGYLNDEIKEAQRDVQMYEVLKNLAISGAIKPEYIKHKLHIPDEFWTGKFDPMAGIAAEQSGFGGENGSKGSSPKDVSRGEGGQQNAKRKKAEAEAAQDRKKSLFINKNTFHFLF